MLGGARAPAAAAAGSGASPSRRGRAAHCYRSPGPPTGVRTVASPWPGPETRTKRLSGRVPRSQIYLQLRRTTGFKMVCGGFACSKNCLCVLNLLYTVSISSQLLRVCGLCTCAGASRLPRLASDSACTPRPLPVFPRSARRGLAISPRPQPGAGACRSLLLSLIVKPPSFWLAGLVCASLLSPAPSPIALFSVI